MWAVTKVSGRILYLVLDKGPSVLGDVQGEPEAIMFNIYLTKTDLRLLSQSAS